MKQIVQQANLEADDYCQLEEICAQRIRVGRVDRLRTDYDIEESCLESNPIGNV